MHHPNHNSNYDKAVVVTKNLSKEKQKVIYEASFSFSDVFQLQILL